MPPFEEYMEEVRGLWESRWLTHSGVKHQKLTEELCKYLKTDNVVLFVNGHLALEAALEVLPLKGEIITTPFTFASTTQAIVHAGLTPVFCDINPADYTLDPNKLENLITEKTSAILPVHVYGNLCDWKSINKIARKHGLKVIYDAAHAFGMEDNGVSVANFGDISMFSFHATKVFHTIEGGAMTFTGGSLSEEFAAWRQFGMKGKENAELIGTNAKMNEFAAAMGLCNLRHIDAEIKRRKAVTERYRENLSGRDGIILCDEKPGVKYNYAYFPVRFIPEKFGLSRDEIIDRLALNQIFARKYFYPLTSEFSVYQGKFPICQTPAAKEIADQIMTLPLYADLELSDADRICGIILK